MKNRRWHHQHMFGRNLRHENSLSIHFILDDKIHLAAL
jgi:hypothetical protein